MSKKKKSKKFKSNTLVLDLSQIPKRINLLIPNKVAGKHEDKRNKKKHKKPYFDES